MKRLQESLNVEATRSEAAEALRNLVEEIRLVPEGGQLQIELAGILALTAGSKKAVSDRDGVQVTLVAGPATIRRHAAPVISHSDSVWMEVRANLWKLNASI